jgi:hypothetical protein
METDAAEDRMMKYLLGNLSATEEEAFEEEFFADGETFAHLLAVENDLVDGFIKGELTGTDRRRFANRLLATPEGRQKLENAQALRQHIDNAKSLAPPAAPVKTPFWQSLLDFFRPQTPAFQYALMGALLLSTIGLAWFVYKTTDLQRKLEVAENHEPRVLQLQRDLEAARKREDEWQRYLAQQSGQNEALSEQLRSETQRIEEMELELANLKQRQPSIFTAVVAPGIGRGGEPTKITLPLNAEVLKLQLPLPPDKHDYPTYSAEVNEADGGRILSQKNLKPQPSRNGKNLVMRVSPRIFKEKTYLVFVKGLMADGRVDNVEAYQFSIDKR